MIQAHRCEQCLHNPASKALYSVYHLSTPQYSLLVNYQAISNETFPVCEQYDCQVNAVDCGYVDEGVPLFEYECNVRSAR